MGLTFDNGVVAAPVEEYTDGLVAAAVDLVALTGDKREKRNEVMESIISTKELKILSYAR